MARVDVAVTGLFIEPRSGDPASGVVRFLLPQPIVSPLDGFTIEPVEVEAALDLTGRVDIVLSTVSGVNAVYVATVSITGADPRRFEFVVPASGDPVDLAAVQPIIPVLTDVPAQTTDSGPFLRPAANLSDVASPATSRSNLGLGSAATQPTSAFDAAGAAVTAQTAERTRALAAEAVIVTSVTTEATRATAAEAALASSIAGATVSDATSTSKGIVQLAGDLAGTADAPTVPGLAAKADSSALAAEASRAATAENQALRKTSNLSDLTNAATARSNLGLGSAATQAATAFDAAGSASAAQAASQPVDSDLTAIAALSTTSFGRSLLALADAAAGRSALALGSAATASVGDFDPAGVAAAVSTALAAETSRATTAEATAAQKSANLSDLASASSARSNLGLGSAATQPSTAFDAAGAAAAAQAASQPLDSDLTAIAALATTAFGRGLLALADAAAGRTALGLGTAAVAATTDFDSAGAAAAAQAAAVQRGNHTGTQLASTVSDFAEAAQDAIGAAATDSATLDLTYDDAAGTISGAVLDSPKVGGVAVSGTPSAGNVITALSAGAATWSPVPSAPVSSVNGRTGAVTGLAEASALSTETSRATAAEALALQKSTNLADLASPATARTNLGLGSAATQPSSAFDAAGAAAAAQAASQPVDSDLTAIAALSTTTFGRSLLALADAAAGRTALALGSAATQPSSAFVDTTTTQTVAGAKTFTGPVITTNPRPYGDLYGWPGADPTGVADSTAAVQAWARQGTATTTLAGAKGVASKGVYRITDTVECYRMSPRLEFAGGWSGKGVPSADQGSVIVWDGPSDRPVFRVRACWGWDIDGLKVVARPANKPTAVFAINNTSGDPNGSNYGKLRRFWFGPLSGYDSGDYVLDGQFGAGILWEGDNINGDSCQFEQGVVWGADVGINNPMSQAVGADYKNLLLTRCGKGLRTLADAQGYGVHFTLNTDVDIEVDSGATLSIEGLFGEGSPRMLRALSGAVRIADGYWQIGSNLASDGIFVDMQSVSTVAVAFERIGFDDVGSHGSIVPIIRMEPAAGNAARKYLTLNDCEGITEANVLATLSGIDLTSNVRWIEGRTPSTGKHFRNILMGGGGFAMLPQYSVGGSNLDFNRYDEVYNGPRHTVAPGLSRGVGSHLGTGSPEGVVRGYPGAEYTDVTAGEKWIKNTGANSTTGWQKFLAPSPDTYADNPTPGTPKTAVVTTGDQTVGGIKSFTQKLQFRKRPWADAQHPDFGAVPGGSAATNNVALQAWLDACKTEDLWGYLPPDASSYDISTTLNFTQKAGARLSGLGVGHPDSSGARSRVRWTGAAAGTMLLLQGVRNSHIEGLLLDGNSSAGVGLDYDAVSGGLVSTENRFDNLVVAHVNGRGVRVAKSNFQTDQSEYYSCHFFANVIGVSLEDANAVWHDFYGCRWSANGTGITAVFAGTGGHFNLHGGRFLGNTVVDIATYATRSHTFTGVVSESSTKFLQGHSANAKADAPVNLIGCGVQSIEAADRIGITWDTASILNIIGGHYASNHVDKSFKIAASNTRRANVMAIGASFDGNPFTEGTFNYNGLARTIGSNFVDSAATTDAGTIGGGIPFFTPATAWALTATVGSATSFGWSETMWVKVASGTALTAGANNFYMANNNVNGKCAVEIPSIHAVGGADAVLLGVTGSDNDGASAKTIKVNVRVSTNFTLTSDLIFAVTLRPEPISF